MTAKPKNQPSQQQEAASTSRYLLMSGLLHAYYWMDESLQNHIKAAGLPAGSRTQSLVWANIADGVRRPSELAQRIGISRQAIQQILADMQKRQLIELVPDPHDGRGKQVQYSERGREMGYVLMQAIENINQQLEQRLGKQAVNMLSQLLVDADWGEPVSTSLDASGAQSAGQNRPALEDVVERVSKRQGKV